MTQRNDDYTLSIDGTSCTMAGVLRLHSPLAYEELFAAAFTALEAKPTTYRVDLSGVRFMNSCGVTALSRIVLLARKQEVPLHMVGAATVAWQTRTLQSLQRLYQGLTVELNPA